MTFIIPIFHLKQNISFKNKNFGLEYYHYHIKCIFNVFNFVYINYKL